MSGDIKADLDGDGKVDKEERKIYLEKLEGQSKMAWIAFLAFVLSGLYILGFADEARIKSYDDVLDWYWIGLVSIIGFYFGVTAFASKK